MRRPALQSLHALRLLRLLHIAALLTRATSAGAQAPATQPLVLRAARAEVAPSSEGGTTATGVFRVANTGRDTLRVESALELPAGWTAVAANEAFRLAPGATDTWIVAVQVPASTQAGTYQMYGTVSAASGQARDSMSVRIVERRALELVAAGVTAWATAGDEYQARFILRNAGNAPSTVVLTARSSRGTRILIDRPTLTIEAGGVSFVSVSVTSPRAMQRAVDDVVELTATDVGDPRVRAHASSRSTIVPGSPSMLDGLSTIPATLTLRAGGAAAGVSPVILNAAGLLSDNRTSVALSVRAPVEWRSPLSERGEARLTLRSRSLAVRVGDDVYGFSPLTSNAALGFGAQVEGTHGLLRAGAYVQRARTTPNAPVEEALSIGTSATAPFHLAGALVSRGASGASRALVSSVRGELTLPWGALLSAELAASDSVHVRGVAQRARLSGGGERFSYDLGHLRGARGFAGPMRALAIDDASLAARATERLTLRASATRQGVLSGHGAADGASRGFASRTVGATWVGRTIIEYRTLGRHDDVSRPGSRVEQRGVRATQLAQLGAFTLSADIERGTASRPTATSRDGSDIAERHNYLSFGGAARLAMGALGTVSLYAEQTDGNALGASGAGSLNGGGSLQLALPRGARLEFWGTSFALRPRGNVVGDEWTRLGQWDAALSLPVARGATLALRAHVWTNPGLQGTDHSSAAWIELRAPLRLPTGRAMQDGRVEGRVKDALTGRAVAGALVRLGDHAAASDANGRVLFAGLAPGRYTLALDATGPAAGALLVGDVAVHVRAQAREPARFAVSLVRGARVSAEVRRVDRLMGAGDEREALIDAGVVASAVAVLEGERDTLYQTTDAAGRVDFGDVAPGRWVLTLRSAGALAPQDHEMPRREVTVVAGERHALLLQVTPRRRTVTFVDAVQNTTNKEDR